MTKKQVNLRLDQDLIDKYDQLGKQNDRDRTYYMRKALYEYACKKNTYAGKFPDKPFKEKKEKFDPIAFGSTFNKLNQNFWMAWCDKRKKMRKPISDIAAKNQIKMLEKYDLKTQEKIIQNSITNDYQGLFKLKVLETYEKESLIQRAERLAKEKVSAFGTFEHTVGKDDNALRLQMDKPKRP